MKILLQIIFMLITSVCISCNDSEAIAGKPEAKMIDAWDEAIKENEMIKTK